MLAISPTARWYLHVLRLYFQRFKS
jgi:hypothetical protein